MITGRDMWTRRENSKADGGFSKISMEVPLRSIKYGVTHKRLEESLHNSP